MKTDEIRERFLDFFEERDHRIMPPDPLVPTGDPSLLFTGAGMNQFKDEFYGRGDPELKRAATCQKCLRTGDISQVGQTASHHTFFEMLGNFSFGDYFKEESITWAWEFMLEEMGLSAEDLVVSIYKEDEEAAGIWKDKIGVPEEDIYRYGQGENFWPSNVISEGPNGPCGPCSEIFYDRGEDVGCGRAGCGPSCDCGRFVEVWNLVFQQYDRKPDGSLEELPVRNIDTGMGLERMARVMQGVETNYDIDIMIPVVEKVASICGIEDYESSPRLSAIRRIADHARAVVFCIADGVIPSNEERGYVVRRLLRRAVRDGVQMGVEDQFFAELIAPVVETLGHQYPEVEESREHIATVVSQEEEAFRRTVKRGSLLLDEHIADLKRSKSSVLRGKEVFDLYQTYGFPVEMTESILEEQGMSIDMQGFLKHMEQHQAQSKAGASYEKGVFAGGPVAKLKESQDATEFAGYRTLESESEVVGIICDEELTDVLEEGEKGAVILRRTPAYGEAGGQMGDVGTISADKGKTVFDFQDVVREKGFFLHVGRVMEGELKVGDTVLCQVDKSHRKATARNHTATHLLHHALRTVLGEHATQSGSMVSERRLRFDFSNPTELSEEQLREVEDLVNEKILEDEPVSATRMSRSEAREAGALALFGEKYGDIVRVISIGDYSRELCGGTHCESTGEIGLLRITSESSVAGGVRRIEAVTGKNALERLRHKEGEIRKLCNVLNTQEDNLLGRAEQLLEKIRDLEQDLKKQREQAVKSMASGSLMDKAEDIAGVKVVISKLPGGHDELRSAADVLRGDNEKVACLLISDEGEKVAMVAGLTDDLVDTGLSAEDWVQQVAQVVGGGGGGRADLAQAGGSDISRVDEAMDKAREILSNWLSEVSAS